MGTLIIKGEEYAGSVPNTLYTSTGSNTDGAMTQKATTDALANIGSFLVTTAEFPTATEIKAGGTTTFNTSIPLAVRNLGYKAVGILGIKKTETANAPMQISSFGITAGGSPNVTVSNLNSTASTITNITFIVLCEKS